MSVGCNGVRVCGGELCSRSPRLQNLWDVSVGDELPCKKDSGNEKDPYAVAVMRSSIIVGQVPGRYQLLARFFWQIRDRGTIVVCARERRYETPPTHTIDCNDIMTKYWQNLIWWCVHNPPNRQIFRPYSTFVYICSHLPTQFNLRVGVVGAVYFAGAVVYGSCTVVAGLLTDRLVRENYYPRKMMLLEVPIPNLQVPRYLILAGLIVGPVTMVLIGPADFITAPYELLSSYHSGAHNKKECPTIATEQVQSNCSNLTCPYLEPFVNTLVRLQYRFPLAVYGQQQALLLLVGHSFSLWDPV